MSLPAMKFAAGSPMLASVVILALGLAGCASPSSPGGASQAGAGARQGDAGGNPRLRTGTVARVEAVEVQGEHQLGLGAAMGTAPGAVIGNQAGGGTRRDVASVLSVIGGGPKEAAVHERYEQARDGQRVLVRLDNGVGIAVTQESEPDLHVGDRVRVEGRGVQARVLRR
jgi:outer membrane lipoprotein SlyB